MAHLDGYSLEIPAPPGPSTIGISYSLSHSSSSLSPTSSTPLKRKRSEAAMNVTAVTVSLQSASTDFVPIILPDIHHNPDEPYVAPPSPVPTEIIDELVEESAEDCMEAAKAAGVKVRDFAYEPLPQGRDPRAPELWARPREGLIMHDRYVRVHPTRAASFRLPGKTLYNLLSIGWVTREEAAQNWREADWTAAKEYAARPLGAHPVCIPASTKKPTAAYRAALRVQALHPSADDVPEECIYVPPDEPGMDDGPTRYPPSALRLSRPSLPSVPSVATPPISPSTGHNSSVDAVHADKRRRVVNSASSAIPAPTDSAPAPIDSAPALTHTLSRSASVQSLSGPSRSTTPPIQEPPAPPMRRAGRTLGRTQTYATLKVR